MALSVHEEKISYPVRPMRFRRKQRAVCRRWYDKQWLCIIPHIHWVQKWYMSFEKHRYRLVELLDTLIETMEKNPDYRIFI